MHLIKVFVGEGRTLLLNFLEIESSLSADCGGTVVKMRGGDTHWIELDCAGLYALIEKATKDMMRC